jgi:hypothetical protein
MLGCVGLALREEDPARGLPQSGTAQFVISRGIVVAIGGDRLVRAGSEICFS